MVELCSPFNHYVWERGAFKYHTLQMRAFLVHFGDGEGTDITLSADSPFHEESLLLFTTMINPEVAKAMVANLSV